jgi:hypothetical protein
MGFSGTGAVSLNDKYSSFLNDQTATSISGLKGDGATIALLR